MIERFNRQLKNALKAHECGAAWNEHVPWVMFGLRAALKEDCGESAAEAVFGEKLMLPNQYQGESRPAASPPAVQVQQKRRQLTLGHVVMRRWLPHLCACFKKRITFTSGKGS
jgi:hypothetical protein